VLESITTLPKLLWIGGNPITGAFGTSFLPVVLVVLAFGLADGITRLWTFAGWFFVGLQKTTLAGSLCHPLARTSEFV
jgi:hypothetical protein